MNIIPQAGLCNRLRVMFSYLEIAKQQNQTLNIYWKISDACNGHFLDVFEEVEGTKFLEQEPEDIHYIGYSASPLVLMNKETYKNLIPKSLLNNEISNLSKIPYNAVHVRRTDHVHYANKKKRFMNDNLFENFIEKSVHKVYLACDCYETQYKFLNKYSDKVFVNNIIKPSKEKRQTGLDNAIIDLFVCVKSQNFLGTHYSSYSDLIKLLKS